MRGCDSQESRLGGSVKIEGIWTVGITLRKSDGGE